MPVYLFQRSTRYYVRTHIPDDLQPLFNVKEFRFSLKTADLRQARHRSRLIINFIHSMFRTVRGHIVKEEFMSNKVRNALSPEKLREIVRKYVNDSLDWEESYQSNTAMNPYEHEDRLRDLEESILHHKEVAGEGRHRQEYRRHAINLLKDEGIKANPRTDEFNQLCRMLAHADVKTSEVALKWQKGDWSAKDKSMTLDELGLTDNTAAPSPAPTKAKVDEKPSLTLGQVVDAFWKERSHAWKPRTKTEYETCRSRLLEMIGADFPVNSLDYYAAKNYRDKLVNKGLSYSRVNLYTGFLKAVLKFEMQTTRVLNANPCELLQLKDKRRKDELRAAFDLDDLKRLFVDSPEYAKDQIKSPERFWIPLLALYTGARMEELCQLHAEQVAKVDGYWCIVIEEKHKEQSVKTSEKRTIPLHPFLIELGFHKFAQKVGQGHLWPKLPRVNDRYGHYFGRWFKEFKDRCGIDPRPNYKVFHSFRHTVETKLQYEEVDQRYIDQLTGHSVQAESARYGKRSMERLHDNAVMKLDWEKKLDFSNLLKSKWGH